MKTLILFVLALCLTGCVKVSRQSYSGQNSTTHSHSASHAHWQPSDGLTLTYRAESDRAILDSDRLTLIFPDISHGELSAFHFQQGAHQIQIAGDGASQTTVSCRRNANTAIFHSRYENGTNNIRFLGRTVQLANQASVIIAGADSAAAVIPAGANNSIGKQTVIVWPAPRDEKTER